MITIVLSFLRRGTTVVFIAVSVTASAEIFADVERHTDHIPHLVDSLCCHSDGVAAHPRKHNHTTLSYYHRLVLGFGLELWVQD